MLLIILSVSTVVVLVSTFIIMKLWKQHRSSKDKTTVNELSGALRSKEVQAEILIESISDGIIVTNTDFKINLINKAASTMTEWPLEESSGFDARVILRLLADEKTNEAIEDAEHPFTKVLQNRERYNQTLRLISRGNKRLSISLVISPIIIPKNNELVGAIAVFRDVSKERDEEQRRADFISTASHEMRTPVAAIEGYLALALNDKVAKVDVKAREYLEKAHSSTQHLGKLFQDLLTSARAEDGRLTNHPTAVEMSAFIEQLADDLRFGAEKKGLEMEFVHGTSPITSKNNGLIDTTSSVGKTITPLYYALVDPDRIREVITNVFDNAVKYTDTGKVSIGITGNNDVLQIQIIDTGPGIAGEDVKHLFQKFYRVDNSTTRSVGGTGLGLFICQKIVELYNGNIWAESELGKGSTFYINLPRLTSQQAAHLQAQEKQNPVLG